MTGIWGTWWKAKNLRHSPPNKRGRTQNKKRKKRKREIRTLAPRTLCFRNSAKAAIEKRGSKWAPKHLEAKKGR